MTTPTTIPDLWAENANYSQGPDSGNPTKVDPGSVADGHIAGELFKPSAQNENHRNNLISQWIRYFEAPDAAEIYFPQTATVAPLGKFLFTTWKRESGGFTFNAGSIRVPSPGLYRINVRSWVGSVGTAEHLQGVTMGGVLHGIVPLLATVDEPDPGGGFPYGYAASYSTLVQVADPATDLIAIVNRTAAHACVTPTGNSDLNRVEIERIGA